MEYDGINSVTCEAEESDWLDVSYSERKYIDKKPKQKRVKKEKSKSKVGAGLKVALVVVLCVAVFSTMLLLDGNFKKEVFEAVKTASATIFNIAGKNTENKIDIPCNLSLVDVNNGVMTFSGGRAALSLTDGRVTEIGENSVTVALNNDTVIVYSGLTSVMVKLSDEVSTNSLLGKYDGQFTASILQKGEIVKQVVGSETQLTWNV